MQYNVKPLLINCLRQVGMRTNTLFMRAKYRDYYDLYMLNTTHFSLKDFFEMTSVKMKNLSQALFQIKNISLLEIAKHFQLQIKHWNKTL